MTKAEEFDKAWRLAIHKVDFSLFDQIVHHDYETSNLGVKINKEDSKALLAARSGVAEMGPYRTIYEDEKFLCIHRFSRLYGGDLYISMISAVMYKEGKVITQETVREEIDNDPSEGQDWNWENFK